MPIYAFVLIIYRGRENKWDRRRGHENNIQRLCPLPGDGQSSVWLWSSCTTTISKLTSTLGKVLRRVEYIVWVAFCWSESHCLSNVANRRALVLKHILAPEHFYSLFNNKYFSVPTSGWRVIPLSNSSTSSTTLADTVDEPSCNVFSPPVHTTHRPSNTKLNINQNTNYIHIKARATLDTAEDEAISHSPICLIAFSCFQTGCLNRSVLCDRSHHD